MARNYNDWLNVALNHRSMLAHSIKEKDYKDILYYRGKYIYSLRQAYKLNPNGVVPSSVSGLSSNNPIGEVISHELQNHQNHINAYMKQNKKESSINDRTLGKELGLKIRRLSTRAKQINFATNSAQKNDAIKGIIGDSFGLTGTLIKTPIMASAKIASKVGPLAITIFLLPAKVLALLFNITIDASNGISTSTDDFNNTVVDQISDTLKDAIKSLSKTTYETVGRM